MPDTTPTITARSGVLLVVCAPSGTGKTTLIQRLRDEFPNFAYSISCTTRPRAAMKRTARTTISFRSKSSSAAGKPDFSRNGPTCTAIITGRRWPRARNPESRAGRPVRHRRSGRGPAAPFAPRGQYVFLLPPSLSELERRLRGRGTDDEASIARRLSNAASEIRQAHWFDAWIVNDNLDKAYDELRAVYLASTLHPAHRPGLANTILEG